MVCAEQVYPDMGTAAMLKHQWEDCAFQLASLGDRRPISNEDEVIIVAAPDPQGMILCPGSTFLFLPLLVQELDGVAK